MALWGNTDANTSAPKIVVRTDGDVANTHASRLGTTQYGNTVFGVSEAAGVAHAGWVVRKDRGNGRVQYETLVAMKTISSDGEKTISSDGDDDTNLPDA